MKHLILFILFIPLYSFGQLKMTNVKWEEDLNYLQNKLEERHANLYHTVSKDEFRRGIKNLIRLSKSIDNKELIIRISELIAQVGDAHTWLHPGYQKRWEFTRLPLKFNYFEDGLFVTEANNEYKHLIGSKLLSINSIEVNKLKSKISKVGYNENQFTKLISLDRFIVYPEVLKRFGILENTNNVSLKFNTGGENKKVSIIPTTIEKIKWFKHIDTNKKLPIVYRNNDSIYWTHYDQTKNLLYVQLNSIRENKDHSFQNLSDEIIRKYKVNKPEKLVIDLRRNVGGNSALTFPLIYALMNYEKNIPNSKVFIITGRWTLSASIILCAEIQKFCNPIFVGEPTGAKPNLYGENSYKITLPNSELSISYSSEYFKPFGPFIDHDWISPDIYIPIKSEHYFNFKQPILNVIENYKAPSKSIADQIYTLAMDDNMEEAMQVYKSFINNPMNKYVDISKEIRRTATRIGRNEKLDYSKLLYEQILIDYPNNTHVLVNLAQVHEDLKNMDKAVELYKKTLTLLKIDRQTNNYLKHYIEDYIRKRLIALE